MLAGLAAVSVLSSSDLASAQTAAPAVSPFVVDPGVRGGAAGAGGALPSLNATEKAFFTAAQGVFEEVDSVSGNISGENGVGLGPRFNLNSCAGCHAFPAVGGTSPSTNPQIAVATLDGAKNTIPSFLSLNGPVREARFVKNPDGTPDGGVHDLFVITGRSDAPGCSIAQPNFAQAVAQNNVIFRIPTPVFGLGLVENVPDSGLQAIASSLGGLRSAFGISGNFNTSGNDGTITRFGWKAQNKSLLIFAGEAYNVEQGVTNEAFPNERENDPNCQFNATPEDHTNLAPTVGASPASSYSGDVVNFAAFMRLLAAPAPAPLTQTVARGGQVFLGIGCGGCHAVSQTTANSIFTGQSKVTFQPFSDFELHNMGTGLADGVSQGGATGQQFRSAPLWGIGQRIFFLHDGRTNNLITAILAHASSGSEANAVINAFNFLAPQDQQALITFLRAL
jgi:CxxC motif-containing protein (DUF1111 family)